MFLFSSVQENKIYIPALTNLLTKVMSSVTRHYYFMQYNSVVTISENNT